MKAEHQRWIAEAVRLARAQRFDQAYRLASLVICEDEKNPEALWLLATMTNSLHERRWALKALLRLQPTCFHARQLLNATNHKLDSPARPVGVVIRPLQAHVMPPYLAQ